MKIISDFLSDIAKIVFGSAVVGYFLPGFAGEVSFRIFIGGLLSTVLSLVLAVKLSNNNKIRK